MSPDHHFIFRNSTILPEIEKQVSFDKEILVREMYNWAREAFNLKRGSYILFLRSGKKWYRLESSRKLSRYPLQKETMRVSVKNNISLQKIQDVKKDLVDRTDYFMPYGVTHVETKTSEETNNLLVEYSLDFIQQAISNPSEASFYIPSRSGTNVGFDEEQELVLIGRQMIERQFRNLASVSSVEQMTIIMRLIHDLLSRDIHSTKRDVFYMDVNSFEKQTVSDSLLEDLSAMLQVTRTSLNISASSKGIVVGRISFKEKGDFIDCRAIGAGKAISPNIDDIEDLDTDAEMVLVIEKDAVFNRLSEDHFYDYVPSILITAKGQPDVATRQFLKKINDELNLPIFSLMDADPYGFEIMRVYSVGSKALSFESSHLAVPNIKWLGLLPSDLSQESGFDIPQSTLLKMTAKDIHRSKLMLEEEFVKRKPRWKEQLQILISSGYKAEIQALNARDPQYITNFYLPQKIETGDFI
jgi:meiotic recombination protein SPO11